MSVTGHIIGNWNLSGEVNDSGGTNVVPNPPEEATDSLEKVAIDDVVYSITGEQEQADWDQADPTAVDYIKNKPTIPAAQVNSDWDAVSGVEEILNKPTLSAVATSGSYTDLTDTPTIPAAQVNSDWNAASGVAEILNKPTFSTVATSGDYDDLINKPTIPAAQVNSDWDAASGVAQILNKPTLSAVATSGEASDVSYDNSVSGMTATDVQDAVDELKSNLTEKTKDIATATISSTASTKYATGGDGWRICMRNGIVSLDMVIDVKSVQSGWTDVGQIPSNFPYPPQTIYFPCNTWSSASGTKLDLQITTGGVIKMRAGAVNLYYVHLSW